MKPVGWVAFEQLKGPIKWAVVVLRVKINRPRPIFADRNQCELIVVFLCAEYAQKQWCGLEWRAIRDIIKSKDDDRVMFVRFDDAPVDGVLSIDGYIDARSFGASDVARFIVERLGQVPEKQ